MPGQGAEMTEKGTKGFVSVDIMKRFKAAYVVDKNGCWIWTKSTYKTGYGMIHYKGKNVRAHRLALTLFKGLDPTGFYACHTCDVRLCVNPDHLYLGDAQQNS